MFEISYNCGSKSSAGAQFAAAPGVALHSPVVEAKSMPTQSTKICKTCRSELPHSQFGKWRDGRHYRQICNSCHDKTGYRTRAVIDNGDGTYSVELNHGHYALIDAEDLGTITAHRWSARRSKGGKLYATRGDWDGSKNKTEAMHRVILEADSSELVDHKNGDTLDNRRSNLRKCDSARNAHNAVKRSDNTSNFKGVRRHWRTKRWDARIQCRGVRLFLGEFDTPAEAARAYDVAARNLHGSFARLNFPLDDEQAA